MKIITISREFGSGGRSLGKKLAGYLNWDYYDNEIITMLAKGEGLDEEYVNSVMKKNDWYDIPLTMGNSFSTVNFGHSIKTALLVRQREIIEEIAKKGKDCVIVGRDADVILRDYKPFSIFFCADMEARLARCMEFENRKTEGRLSVKEVETNIRKIDKSRAQTRELVAGNTWGDSNAYNMTVNTAEWDQDKLIPALAEFVRVYFEK